MNEYKIQVAKKDNHSNVWKIEEFTWNFVKDMPMKIFIYDSYRLSELVDSALSPLEKATFFSVMYHRFGATSACLLSKSGISRVMGISYNTASKGLEGLVKAKVLVRVDGYIFDNRVCQFYINDYELWELPHRNLEKRVELEFTDTVIQDLTTSIYL